MALINRTMRFLFEQRMRRVRKAILHPHTVQDGLLLQYIHQNQHTEWGKEHDFRHIRDYGDFAKSIPVQDYDSLKPYIHRMMHGEKDVLWSGAVRWFAKSAGTSNDKSKFIPVTHHNLKSCHLRGTWDTGALMYEARPNTTIFDGKMLVMGGSHQAFESFPRTRYGDVSAIMLANMPPVANHIYRPSLDIALMPNSEEKIERMARGLIGEDMRMIAGVPTWTVLLIRRILEITGKSHILEVWPNLEAYVHGGVSFTPYRDQFKQFIPKKDFIYWEIYNASEGYFATQGSPDTDDMLLLLNNGVYFEFLPEDEWGKEFKQALPLEAVEVGKHYAPVITTNAGLWRYVPGDTVQFTSVHPYKIKVSGRTNQFINAFGEEVMVANTDKALAETCQMFDALVSDYTVAPIYFDRHGKGGHEWLVEFEKEPDDLEAFNFMLDTNLQRINSDYEAKRYKGMAMNRLRLRLVPRGVFHSWLKSKGKFGGQSKVPRLANHRKYVDEILGMTNTPFRG